MSNTYVSSNAGQKVMLIIPTLTHGGAERVMSELANEFVRRKKNVHLVLLFESPILYKLHPDVHIHKLGISYNKKIQDFAHILRLLIRLRKVLKKEKPDSVLSFMIKFNVLVILASSFMGLRIFVSDRDNPKMKIPAYLAILKKLTYKHAAGIIAQTSLAEEKLREEAKNKNILVIPNPVKAIQPFSNIKREKIILNVGRLITEKGQKYLIEAFKNLNEPDWKLVILGEGPLHNELLDKAQRLGIQRQLIMPGTTDSVDEWLARASIFVFSSISEGFPNALAEAMASGLPCVSFDCDTGPAEMIKNGVNGILVAPNDVTGLSAKIKLLISDYELRNSLGQEAAKIGTDLNITTIANRYSAFIGI